MGVNKFIRRETAGKGRKRQQGKRKLPKAELEKRLRKRMPKDWKASVKRHTAIVEKTALTIASQLGKKGSKVDLPLLRKMAKLHDSFRDMKPHDRIAKSYFERKGFAIMARGIGRHMAAKPERLKYFTLEEKIMVYSDEVTSWFKEKDLYKVQPLDKAIEHLNTRHKGNPVLLKHIAEEGIAMRIIENELVGKGMALAAIHMIGEKAGKNKSN